MSGKTHINYGMYKNVKVANKKPMLHYDSIDLITIDNIDYEIIEIVTSGVMLAYKMEDNNER